MKKCLFLIIAQSTSKEGKEFMRKFEEEHPKYNFRDCKSCTGYLGYTNCDNKNFKDT